MAREYLRTYREYDIEDVRDHLLILGDLSADCAKCRAIGLDSGVVESCPQCGTPFRFVTSRRSEAHPDERFRIARRILEKKPHLVFIDYTDYSKTLGHKKARDFFA